MNQRDVQRLERDRNATWSQEWERLMDAIEWDEPDDER